MKCGVAAALSFAFVSFTLLNPQPTRASGVNSAVATTGGAIRAAQGEAAQMIPVEVSLMRRLDARHDKPGARFTARLEETAHLKNGPKLPNGTTLIGKVTTDRMRLTGNSRLALRFTEARLKNGTKIPIEATIMNVTLPQDGYDMDAESAASNGWNGKTLQMDQIGALSGVDLHSMIGAKNSGLFVSNKKDDMKLRQGTQLTLAIAAKKA